MIHPSPDQVRWTGLAAMVGGVLGLVFAPLYSLAYFATDDGAADAGVAPRIGACLLTCGRARPARSAGATATQGRFPAVHRTVLRKRQSSGQAWDSSPTTISVSARFAAVVRTT
jgi:hypothetical protein